jgi:hypothetical protein
MTSLHDPCLWIYLTTAAVSLYGFGLFLWWLKSIGHASEVYIYVMLLFLANSVHYGINSYARYTFITDIINTNSYEAIITSFYWQARAIPNLIIVTLIVFRMTRRALKSVRVVNLEELKKENHLHRRATDTER